ncbi:family 78 glycoside hydrolase catalytic domain [Hydrocarboniphaga sp.]|uniref:family 78 glycoside hydrolase catalytic domain n=1 Tax=Hydrocarboniphaga sp. TaxID=2033016 RepID=UPI003D0C02C7
MAGRRLRVLLLAALVGVAVAALQPAQAGGTGELSVAGTTTNARTRPLGIGVDDISLAWTLAASVRGAHQQAYQVRVGTQPGSADIWDSGKLKSDRQIDVTLPATLKLQPATRYHWQVRAWDRHGRAGAWSAPDWFETGLISAANWQNAQWIAAPFDAADQPRPLLRGALQLSKPVRQARLYATARGVYQLWLNGRPVGDQALAPGWTDYHQRLQVQTYDVTDLLRSGANVIGAALADGWFRGKVGIAWQGVYGQQLALKAKLRVTYADGSTEDFGTDAQWRSLPGPYVRADLQDGEQYDARRLPDRWAEPGFDDGAWQAVVTPADTKARLVPQPDEPVRVIEVRPAQARLPAPNGVFLYDIGQNVVGVARVRLSGRAGQTVRLRHGEDIYRRGDHQGQLYTDNLRSAAATDTYTFARDETVIYQPRFTQHGFRYVEITGVDAAPAASDVQAVVLGSDLPDIGDLRLSHPMLDQLVRNIRWGQRGNFLSIPTDTPARDERLGWTGDINVFAPTASRLQDTRAFLSKWMDDLRDAQRTDGNIPAIVPFPGRQFEETGVGWADAFITVPYAVWRATGDTRILRRNWAAMCRFYDFLLAGTTAKGRLLEEGRVSFFSGDWLSLEGVDRMREHPVIATAYFAENTRMMAEMAAALGDADRTRTGRALVERIRAAFAQAYRQADGRIEPGTQTAYAMALGMGLLTCAERDATAARFVDKLVADNYHLKTGFLGTPWLLPALSSIGRDDLAMRLLLNDDYPSWGHEIRMGATTIWERWNGIDADGGFGTADMNSFNHYANGAVGDWMFAHLGGLQMIEPGYKRSRIAPLVSHPALSHAQSSLRTPYGLLASDWRRADDGLHLSVQVPVGTEAEILLAAPEPRLVREGLHAASRAAGIRRAHWKNGVLTLQVGSGQYQFHVPSQASWPTPPSPQASTWMPAPTPRLAAGVNKPEDLDFR